MRKGTLYILGNGFDCCHGLNTSPDKFIEILKTKEVYNEIDTAEMVFERYNVLWGDYESCLADIDLELIAEEQMIAPDYLSDHEYDRDGGIFNMQQYTESLQCAIQESLELMVDNANESLDKKESVLREFLQNNDAVLNFNYTSTLERLYRIPEGVKICHVHGFREDKEKLLLGYGGGIESKDYYNKCFKTDDLNDIQKRIKEIQADSSLPEMEKEHILQCLQEDYDNLTSDRDYYMDTQREIVFHFYESLKKKMQFEKVKEFLRGCTNISRVVVMGHSMSDVDREYMSLIEEVLSPQEWKISQYENSPSREEIDKYSFGKKADFFDLNKEYGKS